MSGLGLPTFLLYVVALMAAAVWSAAFLVGTFARFLRGSNSNFSSSFWFFLGVVPLLAGSLVGGVSLSSAALKGLAWIPDHCEVHPGHPHFCWTHASASLPEGTFFWAILLGGTALFLYSLVKAGHSVLSMNRRLGVTEGTRSHGGFLIIPSRTPAVFVAGLLWPRPYMTSAAVRLLSRAERSIVAAHELEHVRRRDPVKLLVLRMAASLFPGFRWIEEKWKAAAELECDSASLRDGAQPEEVSLTILKLARSMGSASPALAYAAGTEAALRQRVESLLAGSQPARCQIRWSPLFLGALILTALGLSSAHHALETILGTLVR